TELSDVDILCETAGTLADATAELSRDVDAVITEYELPDGTGLELIQKAREVCPDASCVLYTDEDPDTIDTTALQGDVTEYVGKDSLFGAERLSQLVGTLLERRSQASYPIPQSEEERLAALKAYDLDSPSVQTSLDRITDLATQHFDVSSASINIIQEHSQEFLACRGQAKDWESVDRSDSICTFTILEDEGVMAVEDVTTDPRFQSRSESLIADGIRSYLGANLVTSSGLVIGPLCVYDDEPRSFSQADRTFLKTLARTAMDLIELHAESQAAEGGKDR
ncbi:MAG: GAF domain-containing protein, partial [Natronomonas sp.]